MIRQKRLSAACLILILAFIWGNSLLPDYISAAISGAIAEFLGLASSAEEGAGGDGLLRKLAHLAEFTALGACLCWQFLLTCREEKKSIALSLAFGILAACVDELIQCFVPGRGPGLRDVGIDTLGVSLGITLFMAGYTIRKKSKTKHLEETKL